MTRGLYCVYMLWERIWWEGDMEAMQTIRIYLHKYSSFKDNLSNRFFCLIYYISNQRSTMALVKYYPLFRQLSLQQLSYFG